MNRISNPFVGLRSFEWNESHLFFGRDQQTRELLEALRRHRFVAVVGGSGSGKSSLVRAGLVPTLRAGFLCGDLDRWEVQTFTPGASPVSRFAEALPRGDAELAEGILDYGADAAWDRLVETYENAPRNFLFVVDQFEETFRFEERKEGAQPNDETLVFVEALLELASRPGLPVYVVLTMRSDFIGGCQAFYGLPEAMNASQYLVPRLTREQRRRAIEGPIHVMNASIEKRLLDRLLNESTEEDQLPVMQHALMRTWTVWEQDQAAGPIRTDHYEAAGRLDGALAKHAEEALAKVDFSLARRVFQTLTDTDAGNRRIRRPAKLSELAAVAGTEPGRILALLEIFRSDGRNFVRWKDPSPGARDGAYDPVVDISHESLIRRWKRLEAWVKDEADSATRFCRLAEAARACEQGEGLLLRDPALQVMLDWREAARPTAAWAERYTPGFDGAMRFLEISREQRDREIEREKTRQQEKIERAQELAALRFRELKAKKWLARVLGLAAGVLVLGLVALGVQYRESKRLSDYHSELANAEARFQKYPQQSVQRAMAAMADVDDSRAEAFLRRAFELLPGTFIDPCIGGADPPVFGLSGRLNREDARRWQGRSHVALGRGRIATAEGETVWLLEQGRTLEQRLGALPSDVTTLSFSENGEHLVAGTSAGVAVLWQLDEGQSQKLALGSKKAIQTAAFQSNEELFLADADGGAAVWDIDGGTRRALTDRGSVTAVAFERDGNARALGNRAGEVYLDSGGATVRLQLSPKANPEARPAHITAVAVGAHWVVAASRERLLLWRRLSSDSETLPFVSRPQEGGARFLALSPDGRFLATVGDHGHLRQWELDPQSGPVRSELLNGHDAEVESAVYATSPRGGKLYSLDVKGIVLGWEVSSIGRQRSDPGSAPPDFVQTEMSRDGRWQARIMHQDVVWVRRLDEPGEPGEPGEKDWRPLIGLPGEEDSDSNSPEPELCALTFSGTPSSPRVLTAYASTEVCAWELDSSEHGRFQRKCFGNDAPPADASCEVAPTKMALHPDGDIVFTATPKGVGELIGSDGTAGRVPRDAGAITDGAFGPDGSLLAVIAGNPGVLQVYRLGDRDLELMFEDTNAKGVAAVTFSSDGDYLATASGDGIARVYDVTGGGALLETLDGLGHELSVVAFSADGARLLAGGNGVMRIWPLPTDGHPGTSLSLEPGRVKDAAFLSNERLVTLTADGATHDWELTMEWLREQAELRVGALDADSRFVPARCTAGMEPEQRIQTRLTTR